MSMSVGSDSGDEDTVMSEINTTPLVDIMLVLLIIFLITSPVVLKLQKVNLPIETNQVAKTTPEDVNHRRQQRRRDVLEPEAPEQHRRTVRFPEQGIGEGAAAGSEDSWRPATRYEFIGKVLYTAQRAGVQKVGFITEPPDKG
jgi:biopolymer transport protein ExbD